MFISVKAKVAMARRSDHSREELVGLALDAAERIVEKDGLRALTARNIAGAIGYSPGTLYNLFGNLDDLVLHLNGRTLDRLDTMLDAVQCTGDPEADLCRFADAYIGFLSAHPNLWGILFEFHLSGGGELPEWYHEKIAGPLRRVEQALAPLYPAGSGTARADAARVLWAGVHGLCSLQAEGQLKLVTEQSVEVLARSLVVHFLAGVGARRGE